MNSRVRSQHAVQEFSSKAVEGTGSYARRFDGYLVAVGATIALLVLRLVLHRWVQSTSPFLFFAPR